ncbi:MAG: sigma-70 family RNA polymerase sigma factor [Bacteroidetes bacterium]|nr:sigma-70 family RNA polymerase sigma factor [Bacteroidota bacterium]
MKQDEDFNCIDRVLNGQVHAYAQLVEKYQDMVFTIVFRVLQHQHDAEDVAQQVFLKAFNGLQGFNREARFATWLYRIAYNTAISEQRKSGRNKLMKHDQSLIEKRASTLADEEIMEEDESLETMLMRALAQLKPDENALIGMYYTQSLRVEEISQIIGLSVSNVKVKLFRTRKKLEELIEKMRIQTVNR